MALQFSIGQNPAPLASPARLHLVLHLPAWATDTLRRAEPGLPPDRPLALWETVRGGMRLCAVDRHAERAGLSPGQPLSDARALCPGLIVREADHEWLAARFADFADWHSYAGPIVSVLPEEGRHKPAYGTLGIDIAGVAHLYGGEQAMLDGVTTRLENLGFSVSGAIAPAIGTAWALARHRPGTILAPGGEEEALAPLPVSALRLPEATIAALGRLGLKRVGQLYARQRKAMQARFGSLFIARLDEALGRGNERLVPRLPAPERHVERRFAEPIGLIDDVLATTADLALRLAGQLEREAAGAQGFHLFLYRVDHKVMVLSVNAARPTRDPGHIARLFAHRADRLGGEYDAGFGIDMIRLAATTITPLAPRQDGAFAPPDGTADLVRLKDRMASRLGPLAVSRTGFVDSHIPERAVRLEPAIAPLPDDPRAAPDPALPRPLRLLPAPERIEVLAQVPDGPPASMVWRRLPYRFLRASGPERIGIEWWVPGEEALTRDYYVAEDEAGRRFWIFREGLYAAETREPRWFVHGLFC
ncbi:DNA polymerase Y family protein [Arsenicitalea aurantiaca]|uniref:DNA polymerase Y family protein n=1 Tax=Arsenicitalea aurantiaca TaxID=1783274 RepID=A0A433X5N3_9HYPH|nr:DNA polymerase Y family protein [Arsenicitalea aurantiaca]RUT29358.1 DNA polymerase Y family protein [Arsenicitalea aurantiaca]